MTGQPNERSLLVVNLPPPTYMLYSSSNKNSKYFPIFSAIYPCHIHSVGLLTVTHSSCSNVDFKFILVFHDKQFLIDLSDLTNIKCYFFGILTIQIFQVMVISSDECWLEPVYFSKYPTRYGGGCL